MLNRESRKYFRRAFLASGTSLNPSYRLNDGDHLQLLQRCTQIDDVDRLIEYLKTANDSRIARCNFSNRGIWSPTIECSNAPKAFLTKTPDEIYVSEKNAPILDTMFSFNSQEAIQFRPRILQNTEPLLREDPRETSIVLPFRGFTRRDYPQVIHLEILDNKWHFVNILCIFRSMFKRWPYWEMRIFQIQPAWKQFETVMLLSSLIYF